MMPPRGCGQEMCRNWGGDGCVCAIFDIEPDINDQEYL